MKKMKKPMPTTQLHQRQTSAKYIPVLPVADQSTEHCDI